MDMNDSDERGQLATWSHVLEGMGSSAQMEGLAADKRRSLKINVHVGMEAGSMQMGGRGAWEL